MYCYNYSQSPFFLEEIVRMAASQNFWGPIQASFCVFATESASTAGSAHALPAVERVSVVKTYNIHPKVAKLTFIGNEQTRSSRKF